MAMSAAVSVPAAPDGRTEARKRALYAHLARQRALDSPSGAPSGGAGGNYGALDRARTPVFSRRTPIRALPVDAQPERERNASSALARCPRCAVGPLCRTLGLSAFAAGVAVAFGFVLLDRRVRICSFSAQDDWRNLALVLAILYIVAVMLARGLALALLTSSPAPGSLSWTLMLVSQGANTALFYLRKRVTVVDARCGASVYWLTIADVGFLCLKIMFLLSFYTVHDMTVPSLRLGALVIVGLAVLYPFALVVSFDDATYVDPTDDLYKVDYVVRVFQAALGIAVTGHVCFFLAKAAMGSRNLVRRWRLLLYSAGVLLCVVGQLSAFIQATMGRATRISLVVVFAGVSLLFLGHELTREARARVVALGVALACACAGLAAVSIPSSGSASPHAGPL